MNKLNNTILLAVLIGLPGYSTAQTTTEDTFSSFEKLFGVTEGKRRNHTKGFCFTGTLAPVDKQIQQYSTSALFTETSKVTGRLSHKGGNNQAADHKPGEYGISLSINTSQGVNMMAMNTLDFFPVATPQAFAELMRAKVAGKEAVKRFKQSNKDLQRFKQHMAKKDKQLKPYEAHSYNSINSFYLVDKQGAKTAVRWTFVPSQSQPLRLEPSQNFLFANLQQNLKQHGVSWNMLVTVANPDDEINNAALAWQGPHTTIVAARLDINSISSESQGKCDKINFDPMQLTQGLAPSEDPLLQARRNIYALGFGKRMLEKSRQN